MPKGDERTSNIVIKPSALVGGLATVVMLILGYFLAGMIEDFKETHSKQWKILSDLKTRVAVLESKHGIEKNAGE